MIPGQTLVPDQFIDVVPALLRARPQWVVWRHEQRDGKVTKIPVCARTGSLADSTDPSTWSPFDEACSALQRDPNLAGVGFVFSSDDPYCGIDLDQCIGEDGKVVAAAQEIINALASYTEISPSGKGVKIFIRGKKPSWAKCRSKAIAGFKETEVYDRDRFFTVTRRHLPGTPTTVEDSQSALESLCLRLWPQTPSIASHHTTRPPAARAGGVHLDDDELIQAAMRANNGDRFRRLFEGDTSLHGGDDSAADLALCNMLAFWTGRDAERMDRLFRGSGLFREKWERDDYRNGTLTEAIANCSEVYTGLNGRAHAPAATGHDADRGHKARQRPRILINTYEHLVVDETVRALAADPDLYQRGSMLVRVIREQQRRDGTVRPEGSAVISAVPSANLRDRMTRCAEFTKRIRQGGESIEVLAHPTPWLVGAVESRGEWSGIRALLGVSDTPVLRPDGSLWQTPGYDPITGVLFMPGQTFPLIPEGVTIDDAEAALDELMDVVCDFRFESDDHRAAWLAGLLTPIARFAFDGPAPLFLIDANIRGAGKGLLAQIIGQVVLGREMPVSSYAHDSDEMRKKVTAIALAGDRMVHLDNLEGSFGNDTLDRALTTTRWKDRILGTNELVDLPLLPVWYGTGNNVAVAADTARRIIHIRLDVLEERPEERTDFRHPDLLSWVRDRRADLLVRAMTILVAYYNAGRPSQNLTPFGSFEGWSSLVRQAVVWVGMPDPCRTRTRLAEVSDTTSDTIGQLILAWQRYDPPGQGVVIADMIHVLYRRDYVPSDEASVAMRAALENFVGCPPGKTPSPRQVGNRLKSFRRRVVAGAYLDFNPNEHNRSGVVWRLHSTGGGA